MATNFPSGLDAFTNPSATDAMDSVTVPHATQHANLNDAVEALEAKVGVDGSAVTSSLDYKVANQGLTLVKSVTVGSGVSSVTVTGAFSSTFNNYLITDNGGTMSVDTALMFYFGSSSSGTNYYFHTSYGSFLSTTPQGNNGNAVTQWTQVGGSAGMRNVHMTVMNAGQALYKNMHAVVRYSTVYGTSVGYYGGATAYTSFTFVPLSGTMTGGTIRVYGYNNG